MSTTPRNPWDWWPDPPPTNVVFGEDCWLATSYSFVHFRSSRPVGFRAGHHTSISASTMFDVGPEGEVRLGDYTNVVGAVVSTNRRVEIGSYVFVSIEVMLADRLDARPPAGRFDDDYRRAMPPGGAPMVIGDDVWIGARAVIVGGVTIGQGAIIGAASLVDRDVEPYAIVAGNPARVVGRAEPGCEAATVAVSQRRRR